MFGPGKELAPCLHTLQERGAGGVYVCVAGAGGAGLKGLLAGVHMLIGKCTAQRAPVEVSISALANF